MRLVLAALLSAVLLAPARATDEPDIVRRFLEQARASCIKAGGKSEPAPTISGIDINGDGILDWVIHYDGYCRDAADQFCTAGGCVFQIFRGWPDGRVTLMIEQSTLTWRADRVRELPALILRRPSPYCSRGERVCDETYVFERRGMRHLGSR